MRVFSTPWENEQDNKKLLLLLKIGKTSKTKIVLIGLEIKKPPTI